MNAEVDLAQLAIDEQRRREKYSDIYEQHPEAVDYLSDDELEKLASGNGWRLDSHEHGGWWGPYRRVEDGDDAEYVRYLNQHHVYCETDAEGRVETIDLLAAADRPPVDEVLQRLTPLRHVKKLNIEAFDSPLEHTLSRRGLQGLAGWDKLEELKAEGQAGLTGSAFTLLRRENCLPNLHAISTPNLPNADEALAFFGQCPCLQNIDCCNSDATDEGLTHVVNLPKLEGLEGSWTFVDGTAFSRMESDCSLTWLSLGQSRVTDAGAEAIVSRCPALHTLHVGNPRLTDIGLRAISGLRGLKELSLADSAVTTEGLKVLSNVKLESLFLQCTAIGDEAVSALARMRSLKHLSLFSSNVSPAALQTIRKRLPYCNTH